MKNLSRINFLTLCFLLFFFSKVVFAQCTFDYSPASPPLPNTTSWLSANGWMLPAGGQNGAQCTLRVLIIFAEIDGGPSNWPWYSHSLPVWKDDLIDPFVTNNPQGLLTKYFKEASSGKLNVIGDYLEDPANPNEDIWVASASDLMTKINSFGTFKTHNNLVQNDFDEWTTSYSLAGDIKPNVSNIKYDHVMVIWLNNSAVPEHQGNGSPNGSLGNLFSYGMDGYTQVGGGFMPIDVARHEFAHFILGSNDFHTAGGGYSDDYRNFFVPLEGGWSMLGLSGSSLQCWNAWDRHRLDWPATGNSFNPSARNPLTNVELTGDLDATNIAQQQNYLLRDFVTTGDALRIKLPYLSSNGLYQEWLWIENHQMSINNSPFDRFLFDGSGCQTSASDGLYMFIQIDKDVRYSTIGPSEIFTPYSDYTKPITAEPCYDEDFPSAIPNQCVNTVSYRPFQRLLSKPNPLTGNNDQDFVGNDDNGNSVIAFDEGINHAIEFGSATPFTLRQNGHSSHAFNLAGNFKIGMGTNPTTASKMNLVSGPLNNPAVPNIRSIYLNGVSVEIVNQFPNGDIEVNVRFDDIDINNDARWCADEIILNPIPTPSLLSLNLKSGNTITIDRGTTATRNINPENYNGQNVFNSATVFRALDGSWINMENSSTIIVDNGSTLKMENGSRLDIGEDATLIIRNGSHLILEGGSLINVADRGRIIIEEGNASNGTTDADLQFYPNARINLNAFFAQLEIAGNLYIKDNATFTVISTASNTFTLGSVKFSSTDAVSQNVFAGNNCGFVLRSNLQVRKMLYVTQETLYAPVELLEFTLQNGSAVLSDNSRIKAPESKDCYINVVNARITSPNNIQNTHRGYWLAGQKNVNIQYSTFQCGKWGINTQQNKGGYGLSLEHCNFYHCEEGLYSYGKFIFMQYTVFNDNTRGWAAEMMSEPSFMYYGSALYNTEYGINYHSPGTSTLFIYDALIDYNYKGVIARNTTLTVQCGSISHNNVFGIRLRNHAILRMGNMSVQPRVTAIDNGITIDCDNANYFFLDYGENELEPHTPLTGTIINGTMVTGTGPNIFAKNNQWNASLSSPVTPDDYVLTDGLNPITITDPSPTLSTLCGQANPPCPTCPPNQAVTFCPNCDEINTDDYNNERLNNASADAINMATDTSVADNYVQAIDRLNQILMYPLFNLSNKEHYILNYDYMQMKEALGYAFLTGQLVSDSANITAQEYVEMVLEVQNKLINNAIDSGNYLKRLFTSLEKAQTYRIASRLYESMEVINDILNWVEVDDYEDVTRFQCQLQNEIDFSEGNINSDEAAIALQNCGVSSYREAFQEILQNTNMNHEKANFQVKITPEKIEDYFTVSTNSNSFVSFKLIDVRGKVILSKGFKGDADFPAANLSNGIYLYQVINESGEIETGKLVIQ